MLDIFINSHRTLALKEAITDSIDNGQYGSLADDIRDCFTEEQVDQIEEMLDSGDFDEVIDNVLSDWSGDSQEELLEELKEVLGESNIEVSFDDDSSEPEDVVDFDDDDEEFDDDDEEFDDDDEDEEEAEEEEDDY
ncbi:MAG: hypothetical protein JXX29_18285 [Deltaproteobacteria bacterium]|nr:hypothetical protein [Deltaproteobacteria bacterium]MBN2673634.1 hypothetical protein [Deltaproteobacteria bacterium]